VKVEHYGGKRLVDLAMLAVAAVPAAVLGGLCAAVVALTSRGPVLFRQERVGAGGATFTLLKFRTMVHTTEGHSVFPDDGAITTAGRFLRRTSLDELPQLLNVLRGEMSVVGPRPTLAYQVARYTDRQRGRMAVRPGVTGLAQVRGRNALAWSDRIDLDLEYVRRQSAWLDLRILAGSARVVLGGSGVTGHPTDDPLARPDDGGPEA
jgi:lipopolysaccharide/colanic/teichoic acid biosynthesis glycosyltransferase